MEEWRKKAWDQQIELWDEKETVKVRKEKDTVEMRRNAKVKGR
jgi:hypothetical protein